MDKMELTLIQKEQLMGELIKLKKTTISGALFTFMNEVFENMEKMMEFLEELKEMEVLT